MKIFRNRLIKTITLNIIAEFSASFIFSLLYFIFISRYLSDQFSFSYVILSYAIGLSFFIAVYVPLHTYRIHIIPHISIINALRKKQWKILWHKIPAQAAGSFVGVLIFKYLNQITTQVKVEDIGLYQIEDPYLLAILNALLMAFICYGFYLIRVLFKARALMGTIFLGLLIAVLFFLSGSIANLSALNPFGTLFYDIINTESTTSFSLYLNLLIHLVAPIIATIIIYFIISNHLINNYESAKSDALSTAEMKNYDI